MTFNKVLYENTSLKLVLNYTGVSEEIGTATDIKLYIYAFDKRTYQEIFSEELNIGQIKSLYEDLNKISIINSISVYEEDGSLINIVNQSIIGFITGLSSLDGDIISTVMSKISTIDIVNSLSVLDLDNLSASHKQQKYKLELKKLNLILTLESSGKLLSLISKISFISEYSAGQPEKILQNWIEKNLWVFGVEYERLESFREISKSSEGDLIMSSIDGYLDLIELKKSKYDLLRYDKSHSCYHGSSNLNIVIGQSMHYLKSLQEYASNLSSEYDVKILRPRIKIIAGRSKGFNSQEYDTLRMINSHLVDISIITYDEILKYGNKIISHYA